MSDNRIVCAEVFDRPERKCVSLAGSFGAAVSQLEDACLSDSEGLAVILTMDRYNALTQSRGDLDGSSTVRHSVRATEHQSAAPSSPIESADRAGADRTT